MTERAKKLIEMQTTEKAVQASLNSRIRTEASSNFLRDVTALSKKFNGYVPTSKSDYVVCTFDSEKDAQGFWKAAMTGAAGTKLEDLYPEFDMDLSNDGKTIKVAEHGF